RLRIWRKSSCADSDEYFGSLACAYRDAICCDCYNFKFNIRAKYDKRNTCWMDITHTENILWWFKSGYLARCFAWNDSNGWYCNTFCYCLHSGRELGRSFCNISPIDMLNVFNISIGEIFVYVLTIGGYQF